MNTSHFDQRASSWDTPDRARQAEALALAMRRALDLDGRGVLGDYGAGTGLILLELLPFVERAVAMDSSEGMRRVLADKLAEARASGRSLPVEILDHDLLRDPPPPMRLDHLVSSMTLHHLEDPLRALRAFRAMLNPGGGLACVDLDLEDGSFHKDNVAAGVRHHGFDRAELGRRFREAGFVDVHFSDAPALERPDAEGRIRRFRAFLASARRPRASPRDAPGPCSG
jgi:SAM-dependent methyltransferase